MLALILAAVLAPANARHVLAICDTDTLTRQCALYLSGYLDALYAQEAAIMRARNDSARQDLVFVSFVQCLPEKVDVNEVRLHVVKSLRRLNDPNTPGFRAILGALLDAYPCKDEPTK